MFGGSFFFRPDYSKRKIPGEASGKMILGRLCTAQPPRFFIFVVRRIRQPKT